jgi:hypothetical protein
LHRPESSRSAGPLDCIVQYVGMRITDFVGFGSPWWVAIFGIILAFAAVGVGRIVRTVRERRIVRESRRRRQSR